MNVFIVVGIEELKRVNKVLGVEKLVYLNVNGLIWLVFLFCFFCK